jgi:hypothetical protein
MIDYGTATTATWPEPERIPWANVKPLGSIGRRSFAALPDGRELELGRELAGFELSNRPRSGEVWIERSERVPDPVYGKQRSIIEQTLVRATLVEPGTFRQLAAAEQAKADARERAAIARNVPHYIDLAATFPQLDRVPEQAVALGVTDDVARDIAGKHRQMLVTGGREAVRGIDAIAAWIDAALMAPLGLVGDELDVKLTRWDSATLEVIDAFRPLLVGRLRGQHPPCRLKHKQPTDAWTLTAGGRWPICRAHLEELDR